MSWTVGNWPNDVENRPNSANILIFDKINVTLNVVGMQESHIRSFYVKIMHFVPKKCISCHNYWQA